MLRFWKLLRILWAMMTRTPYVQWRASGRPRDEELRYRAHRIRVGCALLCDILGIEVRTEGRAPEDSGMLVVANHFGVLDPLVLASVLPSAPVGKAEVKDWPLVGWVSITHGMIPVERARRSTVARFTDQVRERLSAGVHVFVFPEGTTSGEPAVRLFKTGAFEAVAGMPGGRVLPVYLSVDSVEDQPAAGAVRRRVVWADDEQSFGEHAFEVAATRRMQYTVWFGEPIPTEGRDRKDLAQLAREAVEDLRTRRETITT